MTMPEAKSIEQQLVKISVRTLWFIVASVVVGVWVGAMFYSELKLTQQQILNEVTKTRLDFNYQIKDIQKDIQIHESRINQLEKGSE